MCFRRFRADRQGKLTNGKRFALLLLLVLAACTSEPAGSDGDWRQGAVMPSSRSEMPAAVLDDRIYVPGGFGGRRDFAVYDPVADAWEALAELPEPRHHAMAATHEDHIYLFGGSSSIAFRPTSTAWVYDPGEDAWSELSPMPESRMSGAAVSLGDYLYVIGGAGGSNDLLRYHPATDSWDKLAALGQGREHVAAVVFDGMIYALGGRWNGTGELTSVEIFAPETNAWTPGPDMDVARAGFGAAVLMDEIVVVGGEVLSGRNQALVSVEIFDPATGVWSTGPDLPLGLHGVPAAAVNGELYVLGGSERAGGIDNNGRVLIYQP